MHLLQFHFRQTLLLLALPLIIFTTACSSEQQPDPQLLIDQAIAAHGGERYDRSVISFRFKGSLYRSLRDGDAFVYSRTFQDSTGQRVHDVLRNSGFTRTVNDEEVDLPEEKAAAYAASVHDVLYLTLLPYPLNDGSLQKRYLGEAIVEGEPYHKIEVAFAGDENRYKDAHIYWVHKEHHTVDYLAYSSEEEGGGSRFLEAANPRTVDGIRFQDYIMYTATEELPLERYDKAFEAGKLKKESEINLEEVKVSALPAL